MNQLSKLKIKSPNCKKDKISVFDLDRTLLSVNSSFTYYFYLRKKKIFSFFSLFICLGYLLQSFLFKLSPEMLHWKIFNRFLKGKKKKDVFGFVKEFYLKFLSKRFYKPAIKALKKAQKEGHFIYILSNSPEEIVKVIAKHLNIGAYKASKYKVDKDDVMLDIHFLMGGSEKAKFIKNLKEEEEREIYAFSDSIWDFPLFSVADYKIAVNPDRRLKKIAKKNLWQVI